MKKTLLIGVAMVLVASGADAQINLTTGDLPAVGTNYTIYRAYSDTAPGFSDSIAAGVVGAGGVYDVSKAPFFNRDTFNLNILAATGSPWAANHPASDMYMMAETIKNDSGEVMGYVYVYLKSAANVVTTAGLTALLDTGALFSNNPTGIYDTAHADYNPVDTVISTTYTYGYTGEDSSRFSVLIAGVFTHDERVKQNISVDGYGLITNTAGTFNALRINVTQRSISYNIVGTDTVSIEMDTSYYYEYWSKGVGYPVATIYMDSQWKNPWGVEYINAIPAGIESFYAIGGISVYPNPGSGVYVIETEPGFNYSALEVYNGIGSRVLSREAHPGAEQLDLSKENSGIYYVVLRASGGEPVYASRIVHAQK